MYLTSRSMYPMLRIARSSLKLKRSCQRYTWHRLNTGGIWNIIGPIPSTTHNFGTRSVLLTMAAAQHPKTILTTCNSPRPPCSPHSVTVPQGIPSIPSIQPCFVQYDRMATSASDDGMGRPSKYLALPPSFLGIRATVALNRASRARPQQMKPVRTTVSR